MTTPASSETPMTAKARRERRRTRFTPGAGSHAERMSIYRQSFFPVGLEHDEQVAANASASLPSSDQLLVFVLSHLLVTQMLDDIDDLQLSDDEQ